MAVAAVTALHRVKTGHTHYNSFTLTAERRNNGPKLNHRK